MAVPTLRTARLELRAWRDEDLVPFAAMNADAEGMRFVGDGSTLTDAESAELLARIREQWSVWAYGLWAVSDAGGFVGFAGLVAPWFLPQVTPAAEIGWRLRRAAWGRGYATEAGRAVLDHAFGALGMADVVATIHPENARSLRVADKLGLAFAGERVHPGAGRAVEIHRGARPAA